MRAGDFRLFQSLPVQRSALRGAGRAHVGKFPECQHGKQPQAARGLRGRVRKALHVGPRMTRMWIDGIEKPTPEE